MASLKEEALAYEPKRTKNIADLPEFNISNQVVVGEGKDKEGNTYNYKYILLNDEEYRVPESVLGEIKEILKLRPMTTRFKANQSGSGLATRYKVIALN